MIDTAAAFPVTIRRADPSSDADLAQLDVLQTACDEEAYGASYSMSPEQRRTRLESTPYWDQHTFVAVAEAFEGGETIVGIAGIQLPLQENRDTAWVYVAVHPAFRRRGIGTALLEQAALPVVRESGRAVISSFGDIPAEGDPNDPGLPANALARRAGVERKSMAVTRAIDLPVAPDLLDRLEAGAAAKLGQYRIETWQDRVPDEHIAAYGALLTQLELDDPDEDMESEAAQYPPERIRLNEERRARAGTRCLTAVAIAPDGTFAGNTEIQFSAGESTTLGFQENTLVMPDHRGHSLGLALKVANHRQLAEEAPGLRRLVTWNSHVNPWMIAINEKLGYRVIGREVAYQGPAPA